MQGRTAKLPFHPRTYAIASPINPAAWRSFADALRAFATGDYKGIDLDHCLENTGVIASWAKSIIDLFLGTYKKSHSQGMVFIQALDDLYTTAYSGAPKD